MILYFDLNTVRPVPGPEFISNGTKTFVKTHHITKANEKCSSMNTLGEKTVVVLLAFQEIVQKYSQFVYRSSFVIVYVRWPKQR